MSQSGQGIGGGLTGKMGWGLYTAAPPLKPAFDSSRPLPSQALRVRAGTTKMVVIVNPCNPTGT